MRLRFALAGIAVASAFLAACSAGTSCGFGCPPVTTPTPTPAPISLAGTETQDFTYFYGDPTVEPPSTITTQIAQTVTVAATALASPFPVGAANDVHIAEVDQLDQLQTIKSTSDSYTATSGGNVLLYGSVVNTPATSNGQSSTQTLVYATPQIVDRSPETNGASWTNEPGAQLTEAFGDGHSEDRTIANNGTYTEIGTAPAPNGSGYIPVNLDEQSSGAGTYAGPFFGLRSLTFAIGAPAGNPATVTATYQIGKKPKKTIVFHVPLWYPASPKFYAEADGIRTDVTLPHGCTPGAAASEVKQKISRLDTVIGYTETSERDTYAVSGGVVCVVFADTLDNFYDWNGDTTFLIYASPNAKRISKVVTSELITTVATSGTGANARRAHGVRVTGIPIAAVAALQERFNAKMDATKRALFNKKRGVR